jgi:hypothetical protein
MSFKLVYALRQRTGLPTEEFQRIWREEHGPLVASVQTPLRLIKYIQVHRFTGDFDTLLRSSRSASVTSDTPFDIVDEYWFDGSKEDVIAAFNSEKGKAAWKTLRDAEAQYIDFAQSHLFFVQERLVVPREGLIAAESNTSYLIIAFAEFAHGQASFDHWITYHADLSRKWSSVLYFEKYVQNHPLDVAVLGTMRQERGMPQSLKYSWLTEMWINSRASYDQEYERGRAELRKDEDSGFLKPASISCFAG